MEGVLLEIAKLDTDESGSVRREDLFSVLTGVGVTPADASECVSIFGGAAGGDAVPHADFVKWLFEVHARSMTEVAEEAAAVDAGEAEEVQALELQAGDSMDFGAVDSLWRALEGDDVLLLRASWLMQRADDGLVLPRRQDCPKEAFISLEELQRIHEASSAKPDDSDHKRAPIVAVSHFWRAAGHPDPHGKTLQLVAEALKGHMPQFKNFGVAEVGVFLDWSSLYQEPRSESEKAAFKRSLSLINLWYAHALTTTFLVTGAPGDVPIPYHERGWTSFEYALSWLVKFADTYNVWRQVVDLGSTPRNRPPPIEPNAFCKGHLYGGKHFTNGSDRQVVAKKFQEACIHVLGSSLELDYHGLAWGDAEVDQFGDIFRLCGKLRDLILSNNDFTRLPASITQLRSLETLNLSGCQKLRSLPACIGELRLLYQLDLSHCHALTALPDGLCNLQALRVLALFWCSSLQAVPARLVELAELQSLNIQGCAALDVDVDFVQQLRRNGCHVTRDEQGWLGRGRASVSEHGHFLWAAYAEQVEAEHGRIVNPITGEMLDVMQQCVNLQIDAGQNRHAGDIDAYREVITDFTERLNLGTRAWVAVDGREEYTKGVVSRVNAEEASDVTYDFQYIKEVLDRGKLVQKTFVLKDCTRQQVKPQPILVLGDPAGGKTTFAKQLLIWIMRHLTSKWLVPIMIRTIDLVRSREAWVDGRDLIDQYLELHRQDMYEFLSKARSEGRLCVILDGFDEAGSLERRLESEIQEVLQNEIFIVLTSREMAATFQKPFFRRFRTVRVMELNGAQQHQVIEKQLKVPASVEAFCRQLDLNPALGQMAKNPLLLSVTLSVFKSSSSLEAGGGGLSRGTVYRTALDGMLGKLELAKAEHISMDIREHAEKHNMRMPKAKQVVSATALRAVLRRLAFIAHSHDSGSGLRDFGSDLIEVAIKTSGAEFTLEDWKEVDELVRKSRLPVLAWFLDGGKDVYRFAHLTFQEFLCAEECLQMSMTSDDFVERWRGLVCPNGPHQIISRGWWQQTIQMFCDLAKSHGDVRSPCGEDVAAALGARFLHTHGEDGMLRLQSGVNDSNLLTLASLLQTSTEMERLELKDTITSQGMLAFQSLRLTCLLKLWLQRNMIGPDGCRSLARFLESGSPQLQELNLCNNVVCQGKLKEDAPPPSDRNVRTGFYNSHVQDVEGIGELLEAVQKHPTLRTFDVRGNFLPLEVGKLLARCVRANPRLEDVCGIPVHRIRAQAVTCLEYKSSDSFEVESASYLSTGGAQLLLELLLEFPQPELTALHLASQALASDTAGVVELFDTLGKVVAASERLEHLSVRAFWDCGAKAGQALGRWLKEGHPQLGPIEIGMSCIDLKEVFEEGRTELNLSTRHVKDGGAGLLSALLPATMTKLSLQGAGVGSDGYKMLAQCPQLQDINGIQLASFTEAERALDMSASPLTSAGAVACVIARTALMPNLEHLNLSGSTLTSMSHHHVLTPICRRSGNTCDGGCDRRSLEGTSAYLRCSQCDLDFCPTCCISECPMVALAEGVARLPHLTSLKIADCCFQGGRIGQKRSHNDTEGYRVLGETLSRHGKLTDLDLSNNHFTGPGFPYLAAGVAQMPALQTLRLSGETVDFRKWLSDEEIKVTSEWSEAEALVMASAIARNGNLRRLDISDMSYSEPVVRWGQPQPRVKPTKARIVAALTESLKASGLDTLTVDGIDFPFGSVKSGSISSIDFSSGDCVDRESVAPLVVLLLGASKSLEQVDLRNQDFGAATDSVVAAVPGGDLREYNKIPLRPAEDMHSLNLQQQPVMPHGIQVMASTTIPRGCLKELNLAGCGMNARSLGALLSAMLQRQSVTSLDVSDQALGKGGVQELATFLRSDKKLQALRARKIAMVNTDSPEMVEFSQAVDINLSLATLDLAGNDISPRICEQLRRTMEEKRSVVPFPLEAKICFLLCNRHLPYHLQLPEVAYAAEVSRIFAVQNPLFTIFRFCAQKRELVLREGEGECESG